jgi:ribosomal protein S8
MSNKKIRNATKVQHNNISFESKTELMVYNTLVKNGFSPEYEPHKFKIFEGYKPTVPFYTINKEKKLSLKNTKQIAITYTPDFIMRYKEWTIIIEVKGRMNDVYPYKRKMFRKFLEDNTKGKVLFFEVYNKENVLQMIEIIKSYESED